VITQQPHENTALAFANFLLANDFNAAYDLLSPNLQNTLNLAGLENTYVNMVRYFKTPANHAEVIEALTDWPSKLASDVAWVYVSIDNGSDAAEAVSVTLESVQMNGADKVMVRSVQWGRP
jgi:hypothetical protein